MRNITGMDQAIIITGLCRVTFAHQQTSKYNALGLITELCSVMTLSGAREYREHLTS